MAAIQNLSESWTGHSFREIEDFVNAQLDEIDEIFDNYEYQKSLEQYLTIEATENGTELSWLFPSDFDTSFAKTIQYSTDNGLTWNNVTADVEDYGNIGTINAGEKVLLRGNGATGFYDEIEMGDFGGNFLYADKPCYVYGNAMSLLYGANFANETSVPEYALVYLFCDYNENVTGEWVLSKEGNPLVLPATTLAGSCYIGMFQGCTALATAPDLPAITLAASCYQQMFFGCTSLTTAPAVLPATTLASYCYSSMFWNCTSLTTAPALPATTLADGCYTDMFLGCTSLTAAPELPATTLASYCYSEMFRGCTSLTSAPTLPATTLANNCYLQMFFGCTSLASVKCLASAVSPSNAVNNWLTNVSATGTFTKVAGVNWPSGASGIPSGWTVETVTE